MNKETLLHLYQYDFLVNIINLDRKNAENIHRWILLFPIFVIGDESLWGFWGKGNKGWKRVVYGKFLFIGIVFAHKIPPT
jgi:hypothetical protein